MFKLCLITYTRKNESFTKEIDLVAKALNRCFSGDFIVVVCSENDFLIQTEDYKFTIIKLFGTKYQRLLNVIEKDIAQYYLSVDNDITCNIERIQQFVQKTIDEKRDIGWGRIFAKKQNGIISNFVAIDKLLSHNLIRPLLWKLNIGISVPGQIFCIHGESFKGKLFKLDTFLDDLALGLFTSVEGLNYYSTGVCLGEEMPNTSFAGLLQQRIRWAKGYTTILQNVYKTKAYLYRVLLHGFAYHFLWLVNWLFFYFLCRLSVPVSLIYLCLVCLYITKSSYSLFLYALLYQFFFPFFHIVWLVTVIKNLLIGVK